MTGATQPRPYSGQLDLSWRETAAADLAVTLRQLADDLDAGRAVLTSATLSSFCALGTDVDGTPGVNLDTGDRRVGVTYHRPDNRQV